MEKRSERNTKLVAAVTALYAEDPPCRYFIIGEHLGDSRTVTFSQWDDGERALAALPISDYSYAIVYDIETGLIVGVKDDPEVDAALAAKVWLAAAHMTHKGHRHGEHDEGGAVFWLDGVPLTGPSIYDFCRGENMIAAGISPQRVYSAFTSELIARWNRGPVE